jgi:tRNA threonylcarbamoyladenosine biosynthesis protein TsaB
MLILGVDTSGKNGSIALVRFAGEQAHTLDVVPLEGGTFSAQLVPQISALLTKHNLSKKDIEAFAVASGPGSFTGLRVGLAAVKALAEILQKPIAAISLLEVVMRQIKSSGTLISVLDAGRGEVFARTQTVGDHTALEELLSIAELQTRVAATGIVTADEKFADLFRSDGANVTLVKRPRADAVARLGYEKIGSGETVTPEVLDASYIRRSDAEIMRSSRDRK